MLIPNKGRIIVKKIVEEKKEGILIMPDKPSNEPYWAEIAVGRPIDMFPYGTKVLIPAYAGTKINYECEEYIILKEEDVLCYIQVT